MCHELDQSPLCRSGTSWPRRSWSSMPICVSATSMGLVRISPAVGERSLAGKRLAEVCPARRPAGGPRQYGCQQLELYGPQNVEMQRADGEPLHLELHRHAATHRGPDRSSSPARAQPIEQQPWLAAKSD